MRTYLPYVVLAALALSGGTAKAQAPRPVPAADTTGSTERARALMKQGIEALNRGDAVSARRALKESFELRNSYDSAGMLGQAEMELGAFTGAATHLTYCLEHFPTGESRELYQQVDKALAEALKKVARLSVTTNVDGAEVFLKDVSLGTAPAHAFVDPGRHTIRVVHSDGRSEQRSLAATAGQKEVVAVEFADADAAPPAVESASPPAATPSEPAARGGLHAGHASLLIGGALTVGAGVATLVFALEGRASGDRAATRVEEALSSSGNENPCAGAAPAAQCAEIDDALDARSSAYTGATVSLVATGVLAASTAIVTYLLWPDSKGGEASLKFVPRATATSGGLWISGQF